jgi:hypothetical protein
MHPVFLSNLRIDYGRLGLRFGIGVTVGILLKFGLYMTAQVGVGPLTIFPG